MIPAQAVHQRTWAELGLSASRFVRTTDPRHVANVQRALQHVYERGWIEQREYEGLYCVGCERFLNERDLEGGRCRDHERTPEPRREMNYFFTMRREFGWLREPIGDLCISRPKSRLDWGIELPFDDRYVTYVWFDALLAYASGLESAGRFDLWPAAHHLIAMDILKPHAIFWATMLMAAGYPVYVHLNVHGYWNMGDSKMSKSLGNVIRPLAMRERFGMDGFRYFLLREMAFGQDSGFTEDAFVTRFNGEDEKQRNHGCRRMAPPPHSSTGPAGARGALCFAR